MCSNSTRRVFQSITVVAGILLSAYAYYVETSKENDEAFQALCDINDHMSCSKVFTSKWGRGMGLLEYAVGRDSILNQPNSVYGITLYIILIFIDGIMQENIAKLQIFLCVMANLSSVWLAYILFWVLEDVCVVCTTMYLLNFLLLVSSIQKYQLCTSKKKQA